MLEARLAQELHSLGTAAAHLAMHNNLAVLKRVEFADPRDQLVLLETPDGLDLEVGALDEESDAFG